MTEALEQQVEEKQERRFKVNGIPKPFSEVQERDIIEYNENGNRFKDQVVFKINNSIRIIGRYNAKVGGNVIQEGYYIDIKGEIKRIVLSQYPEDHQRYKEFDAMLTRNRK